MTLVVAVKSKFGLVVAADGMAYYGHGDSDIPHPVEKVKTVQGTNWVFAFSGQGTAETVFHTLQAQIRNEQLSLADDIEVAVGVYFEAFDYHMGSGFSSSLLLAGFDSKNEPQVYAHDTKGRATDRQPDVFALGAQHSTAIWIVRTFLDEASSLDDIAFLCYFAIAEISAQELKVGNPERYRIDVCTLTPGAAPRFASDLQLESFATRRAEVRNRVQKSFIGNGQQPTVGSGAQE